MKIGVFGDSFAERRHTEIWWRYLRDFGHDVTSFGEGGSSIAFSAGELWTHHHDFDFLIWCMTSSNRVSVLYQDRFQHVTNGDEIPDQDLGLGLRHLRNTARRYLAEVYHPHSNEVINHLAVQGSLARFDNLLIIPCFNIKYMR